VARLGRNPLEAVILDTLRIAERTGGGHERRWKPVV
jgi:hypothetical protein